MRDNENRPSILPGCTPDVVFCVLPFSQLSPALDASTLATLLRSHGINSKVFYLNRHYAATIDQSFYNAAAAVTSLNGLLGDWVFRESAFGVMDDRAYLASLLSRGYLTARSIPQAIEARARVAPFLERCASQVNWEDVSVVCFVDTFAKRDAVSGQLMASLGLTARGVTPHFRHAA